MTSRLIGTSFLSGLLLTAAQLGVGGGLGLLDWGTPGGYGGALAWVAFIFTAATLGGVFVARRRVAGAQAKLRTGLTARPGLLARSGPLRVVLLRAGVAVASGMGALVALPLVWLPVRAGVAGVDNPGGTVVGCAVGGVAVGVVFALAALAAGPVAAGVAGSVMVLWVAALASITLAVVKGGPAGARLGVIEAPTAPSDWWSGPYPMIGLYATLALTVAVVAGRLGASRRQIALSGLVGPALLASAYAVAGSGAVGADPGSVLAGGATIGTVPPDPTIVGAAIAGGDVRVAALVAAAVGLLASTLVAMRAPRPALSAPGRAGLPPAATTLVDTPAATLAQAPLAGSTTTTLADTARRARTADLDAAPRPTRRSRSAARAGSARGASTSAATGSASATTGSARAATGSAGAATGSAGAATARGASTGSASPARGKTAVPGQRKAAGRKRATPSPVAAVARPEPITEAAPTPARLPVDDNVRMSRREREHVKWMENLLNTPADPTLTTRRKSS